MRIPKLFQNIFGFWIFLTATGDDIIITPNLDKVVAKKGENVKFVCQVNVPTDLEGEELQIKWKHNGHYIHPKNKSEKYQAANNGQTLHIKDVDGADAGVYLCFVRIGARKGYHQGYATRTLVVKVPPEPPRDVKLIMCVGNSAELSWDPGNEEDKISHYLLQFNTSDSPNHWHNYYDEVIPGSVHQAHINLSPWGIYTFRLLAKNDVDYSGPSLPTKKTCETHPESPGGNPKDVKTLTYKEGKLIVSWTPMPRLLHNGPSFKYVIYWRKKVSTYWNKNTVDDPNQKMWEVSVKDIYGLYEVKVKAKNQFGESRQPAFIHLGHSGEGEPLVIPKDFRRDPTKPVETNRAHFIWEAVDTSPAKIQGAFKGYKIRYWKSSEGRHKWKEVDIAVSDKDHHKPDIRAYLENLPAYTALRAQVFVRNTYYTGPPSQTIDFFTPEGVPDPVRNIHIGSHGSTYVLLKWLPPEEPNGKLLGYDIAYEEINDKADGKIKALWPQIDNPNTLGARITGLSANHNYRFYVWGRTKEGRGKSVFLDVRTEDGKPPGTPQAKFLTLDQSSVNITWTPFPLMDVVYVLEYRLTGHTKWSMADSKRGRSWMVINDLKPNMEYEVRLIAKNKFGDATSSTLYRVKTQPRKDHNAHKQGVEEGLTDSGYTLHSSVSRCRTLTVVLQSLLVFLMGYVLATRH